MRGSRARAGCVYASVVLVLAFSLGAGTALAERPVVDASLLPEPAPPMPPDPTEQRNPCASAAPAVDGPAVPDAQRLLDFQAVWPITRGVGQLVAVIDTGVSPHPRLPGLRPGGDYVYTGDGLSDCDAHGTIVAGLIAAQTAPGSGFAGGAPGAGILSIRQSSSQFQRERTPEEADRIPAENSSGYGNVMTMARAVRTAADAGATVINISEVACVPSAGGMTDGPLGAAIDYAARVKDVVVVAAAGNTGGGDTGCRTQNPLPDPIDPGADQWNRISTIATPAWFDEQVLTVGAVDADGRPSSFTLAGPWVDVAAPGTAITSLSPAGTGLAAGIIDNQGNVRPIQGTSFAAPLVAAVAALVRAHRPDLSAAQVIDRIEATAHRPAEGWNPMIGYGVVDPLAAVTAQVDGLPSIDAVEPVPISAPAIPPAQDVRPRTAALTGTIVLVLLLAAGLGISIPLRSVAARSETFRARAFRAETFRSKTREQGRTL
ncbi:type VII secretion-associated serine protease mycosin [Rhodococcoides yunnanense]|uniref:type VII secretion-associated serine protease mycosin n=1 Tax=Rhodococcoides yunnanense TaxID=278209 RepID=UPI000AB2F117|nr:type VII secretion-associated serine protease mycosin [Rhodococcus yunnanensis]